jgi:hypothetical protein
MSGVKPELGCIYITDRYIISARGTWDNPRRLLPTKIIFDRNEDMDVFPISGERRKDFEEAFDAAIDNIIVKSPNIGAISIGSCISLKSTMPRDHWDNGYGYGVIAKNDLQKNWSGFDLFESAKRRLKGIVDPINIFVRSDASLASLGEYHWRLERNELVSNADMRRINENINNPYERIKEANRRAALVYIKLSKDINGAVTYEGNLLGGKNHPFFFLMKPRRMEVNGVSDSFPGTCKFHGDCYSGLISSGSIDQRLRDYYSKHKSKKYQHFNRLMPDHPIVDLLVYYVAQLCIAIISTHVPSLIVLGGRTINDRLDSKQIDKGIAPRVGREVRRQLRLGEPGVEVPHYPDLDRDDGFIQLASCELPAVYGGLVLASRKQRAPESNVLDYHRDKYS